MANVVRRAFVAPALFLFLIVVEKITVLYLPADWLLGTVHVFGGAPCCVWPWHSCSSVARCHPGCTCPGVVEPRALYSSTRSSSPALLSHTTLVPRESPQPYSPQSTRFPRDGTVVWTALIPLRCGLSAACLHPSSQHQARLSGDSRCLRSLLRLLQPLFLLARRIGDQRMGSTSVRFRPTSSCTPVSSRRKARPRLSSTPTVISDARSAAAGHRHATSSRSPGSAPGCEGLLLVSTPSSPSGSSFFRRELIISRALLVAPRRARAHLVCQHRSRLATLIAIGDHGHAQLAGLGFHTQAGWVSLNLIVLGCLAAIQHAAGFANRGLTRRTQPLPAVQASESISVAVYLLPFTLAVAASLLSQGLAEGFEKLYPLRVAVVLFALLLFRKQYRSIDWSFGAPGIITGTVIGFLWLAVRLHHHTITTDDVFTASALSSMTRLHRWMWIAIRVFGATLTVPIAEELAFRGFVARRVERADFETVPYRIMGWLSLAVSSVTFGALHGRMWPAGILTGAALWALARYKNRLGEAVAAHAAANAVIAVAAVLRHDYSLW